MRLNVDFSKPGTHSGHFTHHYGPAHGIVVQLPTDPPATSLEAAQASVEGLSGRLTVAPLDGGKSVDTTFGPGQFNFRRIGGEHWAPIISFHCSQLGDHELNLVVENGATQSTGIPQVIAVRYHICGMEYMTSQILWLMGLAGCVISGVLLLLIAAITRGKHRIPAASV